jgi:hypothetical protein
MKKIFTLFFIFLFFVDGAFAQVLTIPVVVHVLYNNSAPSPNDNISDQQIFDQIAFLNADFRRQNEDTIYTQTVYRPIAADCEIEFTLASVDPFGNSTSGITRTYTDSSNFCIEFNHMKFDSTGGKSSWDACRYLNLWICKISLCPNPGYTILGYATSPGAEYNIDGVIIHPLYFGYNQNTRTSTHEIAHFLGVRDIESQNCIDNDSIFDTPIQYYLPPLPGACIDYVDTIIISCSNEPNGNMLNNFMSSLGDCPNMFTQGQKTKMHESLNTIRNGLINPSICNSGLKDNSTLKTLVFHNPNSGNFTVSLPNKAPAQTNFTIYDLSGRTLHTGSFSQNTTISISDLAAGSYILQLVDEEGITCKKFIKQ